MSKQEKKMAGAMRIFEALSGVDEELLARCEDSMEAAVSAKKIRPIWYYGKVLAACLCFMVLGVMLWSVRPVMKMAMDSSGSVDMVPAASGEAAAEAPASALQDAPMEGVAEEERYEAMAEADAGSAESGQINGTGKGQVSEETKDAVTENQIADTESLKQESAMQDLQGSISGATTEGVSTDVVQEHGSPTPTDKRKEISLIEAGEIEILGEYVPTVIPSGYTFEGAWLTENAATGEAERVSLCWIQGMDDIQIAISVAGADVDTVDISKPENYNVHLYEIPYAATVPEEYRTVFNHPVFAEKDFSLELVETRMKVVADAGDTDTPRGNFAVLYDDGVLVEFSGDGTAKAIYEMLVSMQ